jgi:RimJ/RimL family protein N-acetyltransferase
MDLQWERMQAHLQRRLAVTPVRMRPLRDEDLPILYEWSASPEVARTWMYRGSTPSFPAFIEHLTRSNVLVQYGFMRSGELIGFGAIYDANMAAQRASIRLLLARAGRPSPFAVDCFAVLADYAFRTFPLRKLYIEANEDSVRQYARAVGIYFTEEARLRDFERFGDDWSDLIYLSTDRELFVPRPRQTTFQVTLPDI